MAKDWKGLSRRLVSHVGLRTRPLGFKFARSADELAAIKGVRRPEFKRAVCQFIGSARWLGKGWAAAIEDQLCQGGAWCLGICPQVPEAFASGESYICTGLGIASAPAARRIIEGLPKIRDKFAGFAVMPLDGGLAADSITFEPDLVIIYGEPGQLTTIILPTCGALGLPALTGRVLGDTGICADGIAAVWNEGEPRFFLPCIGDRAFGGTLPSEAAVVYPAEAFNEDVVGNIEKLNFQANQLLEAALGACPEVARTMAALAASGQPLTEGTPLLPDIERVLGTRKKGKDRPA